MGEKVGGWGKRRWRGVLNLAVRPPGTRDELRREDIVCDGGEKEEKPLTRMHARKETIKVAFLRFHLFFPSLQ